MGGAFFFKGSLRREVFFFYLGGEMVPGGVVGLGVWFVSGKGLMVTRRVVRL